MTAEFCGVAVYGMGRSGTSAVAGLFAASGFYVGVEEELLPANEGNPAGYYENRNTMELNDEILAELGGTWFDPPSEDAMERTRDRYASRLHAAFDSLVRAAEGAPVAIKDPRVQVMMPLWGPVIGEHLYPVVVVRDPVEIAQSLARRDGTPAPFSLAAWEISMTRLLRALSGRAVTVAPYAVVLRSAEAARHVVWAAAAALEPTRRSRVRPSDGKGWLLADLHRNQASSEDHERGMTIFQERLWRWLADLAVGEHTLEPPDELVAESPSARETVAHETARLRAAVRLDAQQTELVQLRSALEAARGEQRAARERGLEAQRERDEACAQTERARRQADDEREARSRADAAAADAQAALDVIMRSRSWRMTAAARRAAEELRRRRPTT